MLGTLETVMEGILLLPLPLPHSPPRQKYGGGGAGGQDSTRGGVSGGEGRARTGGRVDGLWRGGRGATTIGIQIKSNDGERCVRRGGSGKVFRIGGRRAGTDTRFMMKITSTITTGTILYIISNHGFIIWVLYM